MRGPPVTRFKLAAPHPPNPNSLPIVLSVSIPSRPRSDLSLSLSNFHSAGRSVAPRTEIPQPPRALSASPRFPSPPAASTPKAQTRLRFPRPSRLHRPPPKPKPASPPPPNPNPKSLTPASDSEIPQPRRLHPQAQPTVRVRLCPLASGRIGDWSGLSGVLVRCSVVVTKRLKNSESDPPPLSVPPNDKIMMGSPPVRLAPVLLLLLLTSAVDGAQWCIASSEASDRALQAALDYACGPGSADCQPIQPSGLCYLPNTLQAHASYAFNSFYQRSRGAPGACDFAGVATITITDPSYGSCTFPSSASSAGGRTTPTTPTSPSTNTPTTSPGTTTPTSSGIGGDTTGTGIGGLTPVGGLTPINGLTSGNGLTPNTGFNSGFSPTLPNTDDMSSAYSVPLPLLLFTCFYFLLLLLR